MKAVSPASRPRSRGTTAFASELGIALVTTIALLAVILALVTGGLLIARADLAMFSNLRDGTRLYYRARAALVRSLVESSAGYRFDDALVGPDGRAGTSDDGRAAAGTAVSGCRVDALDDREDPDSRPYVDGNWRIRLLAGCVGPRGGSRRIEGIVGRSVTPFVPAALYLGRPDMRASGPVLLDGRDHVARDPPGFPTGRHPAVAPAGGPLLQTPVSLPTSVRDGNGASVFVRGSIALDGPAFSDRLRLAGTPPLPALPAVTFPNTCVHIGRGASVTAASSGSGILAVDGDLVIAAPLDFSGFVVVQGMVHVQADGALTVRGMLWVRGAGTNPVVEAAGPLTVLYSSDSIAAADRVLTLPRRAVLLAERELF